MEYRSLGRTGVRVSNISLGTLAFGPRGNDNPGACVAIIQRALDAGVNLVDTADIYSDGVSEELTGAALKGRRTDVLIATKVHGRTGDGPNDRGSSRLHIMQAVEASLRRLQTDWIDLYQLHLPDPDTPLEETLRAMDDLVHQGKVRYFGTSNFAGWQLATALWASERQHLLPIVSEQPEYSLLERRAEREVLPACAALGLAVLPWGPLRGGLLTGKYALDGPPPAGSRFARRPEDRARADWQRRVTAVEALRPLASGADLSLAQFALLWVTGRQGVTSPIIGPRTMQQLEEYLAVMDRSLPPELVAQADAITARFA